MIARISGTVAEAMPNKLIIDVNGVGYEVIVSLSTFDQLNPKQNDKVSLRTYMHVRENIIALYGFASESEKDLFLLLIDRVSGIGPSTAISILSGMPVEAFKNAVVAGDAVGLSKVKGLGKKTAERIILELKDKVGVVDTWQATSSGAVSSNAGDAELALIALGFKQVAARKAVLAASEANPTAEVDEIIRAALRSMN